MTAARSARRVARLVLSLVGWLAVIVALDWAVGAVWNTVDDPNRPASSDEGPSSPASSDAGPVTRDPRIDEPAMADSPWRTEYFNELGGLRYEYVPFVYPRLLETHLRYINSADGIRRSYEPPARPGVSPPVVWVFGGSAVWGEGQRDMHTIPSEMARASEADGLPVRVVNFGERSYVLWQELQVFEHELAHRPPPDLAVFYDGPNEQGVQFEYAINDPQVADYVRLNGLLTGVGLEPDASTSSSPTSGSTVRQEVSSLYGRYRDHSAVARLLRGAQSLFGAQMAEAQTNDPPPVSEEQSAEILANALAVYKRGRSVARMIGEDHRVGTRFFWQPAFPDVQVGSDIRNAAATLEPETVDLLDIFDAVPAPGVYIDVIHTNELGARLAGEAIWQHLRPDVRSLYADAGRSGAGT